MVPSIRNASEEKLNEIREKVNWLNPESRWLMIESSTGNRLKVVENALVRPSDLRYPRQTRRSMP